MFDLILSAATPENVWIVILLTGVVTYFTRSAGHIILARFEKLHPRVEAALEAVPGAVLVTIVLPPALENGTVEIVALIVAMFASLRLSPISVLVIGMSIVIGGRALVG